MMVLVQWLFLHTAVTSAAAAPAQQMYLAHSYKPKTHSWHNCGRGPNCLFRDVCFPIETKCADAFHHNCALIAEKRAEVVSTSEFFLREKIAKREAHAYDLFRRKLVFFQHREVVFTIVDRYNMENLFVEPHLSDSQHLRRARAQNVPDVVPSDAHVHVSVKRCGQTVGGCGGSNPQTKGESAGSATCTAQTQYVFMLFRPSLIARRKPYGNMLFDDLGSLYMSLKYFGLEEKVSGADFSSGEGVQQEGRAGKNYQLVLLLDAALDDEERAVLDFIVPREFVWTRVDEQSGDLKSWGTVLAEKLPALEQTGCSTARPAVDVGANGELSAAADTSQGEVIDGKEDLVCVKNLITGFAAAGFANSDEIHNHLSTPAYKEVYDDAVGMALSLGLDRGGTSVPDLLGFRRFLYAMRAKMGFVPSSGATPGSAGLAPTNVMKILVALPCCPNEYFSDAGGGTTSSAELDVARTGRTITQIVPLAGEHRDSVVVGKPMVASRYVLDNDGVAIPGNHPRCAKFSVSKEKIEAAVRKIVEKMNGKGVQVQRRGHGVYAPGEGEDSSVAEPAVGEKKKFEVSFVNSCECLPGYFVEKEIATGKRSRGSTSGKASMYASTMLTLLNHVDVLFTLAGFDNFEHDAFVTQAILLPKLSTILAPYRSAEQKDKSRIDEAAFNVFNMETLFPRHTRVLPHHYGPLFQLRRSFRHRPYLNVVEWPMYAVGAWSSSDAVGVSFSYNVTKHKSFLRRNLLKYTGRRLGIEDIEEGNKPAPGPPKTSGTATAGGREAKENPIDPVATRTAEKNPTHSLAYSFCDKDMAKTNVGEYCQVQIWSAGGCANLPLAFGGPQDFYKWFYAQNFQTFVSDTTEWATSSELRHWRVCYGMSMDPHVVARRENLEKELIRRTEVTAGVDHAKSRYSFAHAKAPWSAFVSKREEQMELRDLSDEAVVAGIDHLRNKEAELQKQKYSTTAAYADVPGWRMATAANQYSPGLLGVLRLPCPRRSYQREVEGENGVIELSDRDEGVGSEKFDGHSRRGRCALVFAPTVGWSGKTPVKSRTASAGPEAEDESSLRLPFDEATGQTTLQSRSSDLLRPTGRAEAAVVFAHTKMQVPVVDDATVVAKEAGLTTHIDGYYRPTYGNYTYHFLPPMGERETDGQKGVKSNAEEEALRRAVAVELAKSRPPTSSFSLPVVGVEDVVGDETESESAEVATSGREVSTFTESVVPEAIELGADFADYFGQHLANAAAHAERHAERKEEEFFVSASFSSPSAVKDKPTSSHTTGKRRSGFASASQPGSTTSGSSASSTDAFLRQQQYSSHLCNLGPNCYFQNVCFQQFSNHNQAKPLPPHGHMHHKKITLELDLAYAMPREEHVLLTSADSRADLKVLPGSALGKLWTSVNFPVLANRKDECAEIRVNVYTSPENSADVVSTTEINEENESEESEVSSSDFASLNTANRLGQEQLREWGTADFKQLLDAVRSADVPLLAESEEQKDVYFSRFTRGPGEMDRIFFPRIVESHPLWDFVRTSGASNSVDDEDRKLLEKKCADAPLEAGQGPKKSEDPDDPRIPVAVIFGRYKCCQHNVGHVLLDEVMAVYRHLDYWDLLDPLKYKVYLFLEKLKNAEYFYLVADKIFTWDAIPHFGCFRHLVVGQARLGYYNPYDWHKGMKDAYDILTRAPKSAPFPIFFPFREYVMGKYRVPYYQPPLEQVAGEKRLELGGAAPAAGQPKQNESSPSRRLYTVSIFQKDAWKSENCCVFVNAEAFRDLLLQDKSLPIKEVRLINWVRKSNLSPRQMFMNEEDRVENTTEMTVPGMSGLAPPYWDNERRQCLNSEYSMREQVELMATTDILISFSGADMGNIVFLPEKAAVISFARYMGWRGDPTNTQKQPGWRTSFELASWGRHRPYLIRKEFALEITGMYNYYGEKDPDARPVFLVRPRKEGPAHTPKINEVSKRFEPFLNETSHRNARDGRMIKFLHMSKLDQIAKVMRSIVVELDQVYGIHEDLGLYQAQHL